VLNKIPLARDFLHDFLEDPVEDVRMIHREFGKNLAVEYDVRFFHDIHECAVVLESALAQSSIYADDGEPTHVVLLILAVSERIDACVLQCFKRRACLFRAGKTESFRGAKDIPPALGVLDSSFGAGHMKLVKSFEFRVQSNIN